MLLELASFANSVVYEEIGVFEVERSSDSSRGVSAGVSSSTIAILRLLAIEGFQHRWKGRGWRVAQARQDAIAEHPRAAGRSGYTTWLQ